MQHQLTNNVLTECATWFQSLRRSNGNSNAKKGGARYHSGVLMCSRRVQMGYPVRSGASLGYLTEASCLHRPLQLIPDTCQYSNNGRRDHRGCVHAGSFHTHLSILLEGLYTAYEDVCCCNANLAYKANPASPSLLLPGLETNRGRPLGSFQIWPQAYLISPSIPER